MYELSAKNDRLTSNGKGGKAVLPGTVQMFQGIFTAAGVQGVAVREIGQAAQLLHHVHHGSGVIRAEEADVPQLSEMHFNSYEFFLHINGFDPSLLQQLFKLCGETVSKRFCVKICKINVWSFHI